MDLIVFLILDLPRKTISKFRRKSKLRGKVQIFVAEEFCNKLKYNELKIC